MEPNGGEQENCVYTTVSSSGPPGWSDHRCGKRWGEHGLNMPCYALCTFGSVPLPTNPSSTPTLTPPNSGTKKSVLVKVSVGIIMMILFQL